MIIQRCLGVLAEEEDDDDELLKESTCDPVTSPRLVSKLFLERVSDAFNSNTCLFASVATNTAVVVFPIPGGPDRRAALNGPVFGLNGRFFPFGSGDRKFCSQVTSPIKLFHKHINYKTCS